MKKRLITTLFAVLLCAACIFGTVACKDNKNSKDALDGTYTFYMAQKDGDSWQLQSVDGGSHGLPSEVVIENGKLTYMGQTVDIKKTDNGFSYTITRPAESGLSEVEFVKVADGEYLCDETGNYICKKGQTPSYPVVGEF